MEMDKNLTWLGEQFGLRKQAAGQWLVSPPVHPQRVFEIEDLLEIPGQLCRFLGYARLGFDTTPVPNLADVLAADPRLTTNGRESILNLYRALTDPGT
jgi:hypothetical protein